eukprot:CAMPEP_0172679392 /NCGR_PEP_ID=MMETSP1074-20121228/16035_1 /TAXON_ID=2916 /ORGANISM="Ceratium fusus, Strain PA161109" /LENGTH=146 /DNA_ID=CAMNT_0013497561 /DNA_START=1 /DNA_END=439 /DNA_ORIENTATION=+
MQVHALQLFVNRLSDACRCAAFFAALLPVAADGDTEADLVPVVQVMGELPDPSEPNICGQLPPGPRGLAPRTYATNTVASGEALGDEPFYVGTVLQLDRGQVMHEVQLLLYASGFSLRPLDADSSKQHMTLFWSPFSQVTRCTVRA